MSFVALEISIRLSRLKQQVHWLCQRIAFWHLRFLGLFCRSTHPIWLCPSSPTYPVVLREKKGCTKSNHHCRKIWKVYSFRFDKKIRWPLISSYRLHVFTLPTLACLYKAYNSKRSSLEGDCFRLRTAAAASSNCYTNSHINYSGIENGLWLWLDAWVTVWTYFGGEHFGFYSVNSGCQVERLDVEWTHRSTISQYIPYNPRNVSVSWTHTWSVFIAALRLIIIILLHWVILDARTQHKTAAQQIQLLIMRRDHQNALQHIRVYLSRTPFKRCGKTISLWAYSYLTRRFSWIHIVDLKPAPSIGIRYEFDIASCSPASYEWHEWLPTLW